MRRGLRTISIALIMVGLAILADVGLTRLTGTGVGDTDRALVEIVDDFGRAGRPHGLPSPLQRDSASQRYAVFARLDSVSLFAGSDRRWLDP